MDEYMLKETVEFDPAVFIYLQKKANECNMSTSEFINKIIREKALDEFKTPITKPQIIYREPYTPYIPNWYTNKTEILDTYPSGGWNTKIDSSSDTKTIFNGIKKEF